jgi:hypothetical protein
MLSYRMRGSRCHAREVVMKRCWRLLVPALWAVAAICTWSPYARADKRLAVPDMRVTGADPGLGRLMTEILTTEASGTAGLTVIGSSDIASMLGFEKQKELLGCTDNVACVAEIGGALGVDYLLVSDLGLLGKTYVINLKLIDTAKVSVIKRLYKTVPGEPDALIELVKASLPELLAGIGPQVKTGAGEKPVVPTTSVQSGPPPAPGAAAPPPPPGLAQGSPPPSPALPGTPPPTKAPAVGGPARWPAWTLISLGGVSLAAAAVLEGVANGQHRDATQGQYVNLNSRFTLAIYNNSAQSAQNAHDNSQHARFAAIAGAALVAGGGLWLWLLPARTAVAVAPIASSDSAGLAVSGCF